MPKEENHTPPPADFWKRADEENVYDDAIRDFPGPEAGSEDEVVAVVIATIREHMERKR
ncbi:MAG: hypothetical protein HY098_05915 [Nitrospinae bacterium]|nr:hypothetical protein [Nitrospinota bacterium]